MRAMVIGEKEREALRALKEYAEANPFSLDDLLDVLNGSAVPAGMKDEFKCYIPHEYRIIFTIEDQPQGLSRHLSMSIPVKDKYPHQYAINLIMELLGFKGKIEDGSCYVYFEEKNNAINVVEKI